MLFSGLMFGLFHGNLNQFVYAFVLGLCFGFIYVKTGNIRYTIGLHMLDDTARTKGKPSLQAQLDALEKRVKALGG